MTQKYLDTNDICKMFGVTKQAVYGWRRAGMPCIGSVRPIFYIEKDVIEWLKTRDTTAKVKEVIDHTDQVDEVIKENYPS